MQWRCGVQLSVVDKAYRRAEMAVKARIAPIGLGTRLLKSCAKLERASAQGTIRIIRYTSLCPARQLVYRLHSHIDPSWRTWCASGSW